MKAINIRRRHFLTTTAGAVALLSPVQGFAQEVGLQDIIVTAQKREQSLQDVPIAVTALTQETIQANRIFSVNDLSSIAPGVIVRPSPGGSQVPVFTIRGQNSFGVVPGSDKQVSIYIDGVYVSSPRGSIFELPDIQRLEVLRGPQGTLFGRNATAGAISVVTRDPSGEAHIKVDASLGNRDAGRFRITADLPQVGPFSGFVSYVHNYRRGEVYNAAGGQVWDRSLSPGFGVQQSPYYLGTVDTSSYFGALKFEPTNNLRFVYKFDQNDDRGTPDATGFVGFDLANATGALGPTLANFLNTLYSSQNVYTAANGKRPDIVTNGFAVPRKVKVYGHSLTATWEPVDRVTVKNIAAFRQSNVIGPTPIDGLSGLNMTPAAIAAFAPVAVPGFASFPAGTQAAVLAGLQANLGGQRFLGIAAQASSISKQWSDELQVNYSSGKFDITVGGLWFHSKDEAGGPYGQQNTLSFALIPASGLVPLGNEGRYFNKATSIAAYAQIEYRILPTLEIMAGARITRDTKSSFFRYDVSGSPRLPIVPPDYKKTKPNFLIGLNWTPNDDTLIYGKFSNSFVSGGNTGGIPYEPETATSWELGAKVDFLDRRLRTNLAVYHVKYKHFQQSQSLSTPASQALALPILTGLYGATTASELLSKLSVFVGDQGDVLVKGIEAEITAAPIKGLTIGGSVSYADVTFPFVQPLVLAGTGGRLEVNQRPDWTGSAYASYETEPLFGDTRLSVRGDAFYQGAMNQTTNAPIQINDSNRNAQGTKGYWTFNGRVALRHLALGPVDAELSLWGKNLSNRRDITTTLFTPFGTSANYVPARTYGLELSVEF
ncbi:TonB-dependent receptor [Sphingobium sufflavum]|uniref:TonB-dependent receptor n=1 Tax=Sphingobium sufflavum TaxID=1129547 RepID=UPI001F41E3D5|nr:TonB-dependent receptor [Sphingobium sufflavum]MCE7798297.1 TonB-dependent receptor [Sphingobium sufflavum]